jgi:hypothetical protein
MKTTLFTFDSPVGTFWIRPEPAGRVQLGIDRHRLKTYASPTAAARDVSARATGFAPWDTAELIPPRSLKQWKRIAPTRAAR